MKSNKKKPPIWVRVIRAPFLAWRWLMTGFARAMVGLRNRIRRLRRVKLDYIVLPIGGSMPERAEPPRSFIERRLPLPPPAESLQQVNGKLKRIADAENVKGVLFAFRGIQTGFATLQNLRQSMIRLREAGKEVVVFTPYLDARHYYAATAADRIIVPPGTQFDVLGLQAEVLFLKDALQQIGVQMDVVQISPYKTMLDRMQHADMTPEYREQLEWLLDDQFDMLTAEMAKGRSMSQDQMKALIDEAPFFAQSAVEKGLVDHVAYEDELSFILAEADLQAGEKTADDGGEEAASVESEETSRKSDEIVTSKKRPKVRLSTWSQSRKGLMEQYRKRTRPFIGVITLEGMIVMGPSRRSPIDVPIPLVGGAAAGEQTLVGLLRKAEKLDDMAALIFHVDSGGGSALASDLIARQIQRIGEKIPVLVYMGNVAASGGYYVSAQANYIMSQQATMTGSIGVITARASAQALFEKVKVNRVTIERGKQASLYTNPAPLSTEERQIFWDSIMHTYEDFKRIVADGRELPYEDLDPICEGRVWTGRQAMEHQLVDGHGDFVDAVKKAATLAEVEFDDVSQLRVANLINKQDRYVLPRPFEAVEEITRLLSAERLKAFNGRPMMLMPFSLDIE